jgi:hypothetical protein
VVAVHEDDHFTDVAVGLVPDGLHRGIGLARFDENRWQASLRQALVQPSRQQAGFQVYAGQRQVDLPKGGYERFWFARRRLDELWVSLWVGFGVA